MMSQRKKASTIEAMIGNEGEQAETDQGRGEEHPHQDA